MATEDFYRYRGAVGSLTRSRPADDSELVHARAGMAEETLVDAVAKALKKAPPLAPQARERGHRPALRSPGGAMTVKDDISALSNALQSCWDAAECGEHDGKNPAGPPPREVAWEGATLCSKPIAALLDCRKTGVLPDIDMGRRRRRSSNPPKSSATPGEPPMGDSSGGNPQGGHRAPAKD